MLLLVAQPTALEKEVWAEKERFGNVVAKTTKRALAGRCLKQTERIM
jgi:hypothetical protein